jgi:ferric-dicitrate binding protein FerR (iron transport regulator)
MPASPTHADLVARALGALGNEERARVDLALQADPALRQRYDEIAAHLLRYDHLAPAPAAPAFARLADVLDREDGTLRPDLRVVALQSRPSESRRRSAWTGRLLPLAAAAVALCALVLWGPWRENERPGTRPDRQQAALQMVPGPGLTLVRAGVAVPAPARAEIPLAIGDRISCEAPAEAQISSRVRVVLDADAVLTIVAANPTDPADIATVELEAGRAWFEVGPGPFQVLLGEARGRRVEVVGTAFEIDLRSGLADVAVAHGRVLVRDPSPEAETETTLLEAGWGLRGLAAKERLHGPAGAWFRRPELTLAGVGVGPLERGVPFRLDLRFSNPGQVPLTLRGPGALRTAIWLSFESADGQIVSERPVLPAHVRSGAGLLAPGASQDLQPGQSQLLAIEILPPVGSPGAYRCRALYRPEGQPAVLSEPLELEVR